MSQGMCNICGRPRWSDCYRAGGIACRRIATQNLTERCQRYEQALKKIAADPGVAPNATPWLPAMVARLALEGTSTIRAVSVPNGPELPLEVWDEEKHEWIPVELP